MVDSLTGKRRYAEVKSQKSKNLRLFIDWEWLVYLDDLQISGKSQQLELAVRFNGK
ncbi:MULTISPECIES: hypothetical protein [unclassified Nodularia (in: cyanobacteria)]|uniref:hypothetical protein n=1 Tax=unclassified Nodularia (in: cyanobacteria) TaxID=2656917 RepID=UPI001881865E|nr:MULTISPECIES: hypothetical protein [unclassified Nodularia (in: cyanobacteria)]MBE9200732.1 hypothetical protein [Nodularia sp. LEGE 06071]MCC2692052.1 hypothetical protein [Nodularia sp. LEGE 04288]